MYKSVYLKKGKEESLKRFHPWIFSGAIQAMDEGIEEGEIVKVFTRGGEFIAIGHYQIGSIAVRVLSFRDIEIDEEYWCARLQSAYKMRLALGIAGNSSNTTYRLVHGEGDNLPGLVIDCYGPTAVMQAHSVGMHVCRMEIANALKKVMGDALQNIYYKSETTLPYKADLRQENGFILGGDADDVAVENGLKFHIDWLRGQKTGFFVDQRENRSLLEHYAKGKSVLNMFCYTGGFSVYAMRGDAKAVHSVDSSAKAIELTNENIALNFPGDARHEAICEDAFKYLDEHDQQYDLISPGSSCLCQAPCGSAQCAEGLYPPECKGLAAYQEGWHPFYLQLLSGGNQGSFPQRCVYCSSAGWKKGSHLAPVASACRPSYQYLSSGR